VQSSGVHGVLCVVKVVPHEAGRALWYPACPACRKKVTRTDGDSQDNSEQRWSCEKCNTTVEAQFR